MEPHGREHTMKVKLELRLDDAAGCIDAGWELMRENEKEGRKEDEKRQPSAAQDETKCNT